MRTILLLFLVLTTGCAYTMEDALKQYPSCRTMENCHVPSHLSSMPPYPRMSGPGGSQWNAIRTPDGRTYYNGGGYAVYGPDGTYILY